MGHTNQDVETYAGYVLKFMQQYIKINEQEFNQYLPYIELRTFPKKAVIVRYGETDNYLNLVMKGLARKYMTVGKNERTLQLAIEGSIIQSELSFHKRMPSTLVIEALEPVTLVSISHDNVEHVLKNIPSAELLGRQMMTYLFIKKDARYFAQLNTTTRQRFIHYLTNHPQMLQRVPQKILASYLDIKPETFSRLKHLLLKKG